MRKIIYEESMEDISISRIIRNYEYSMPSKHIHDEYEIYYLISGERSYFIDNKIYHVSPGSLVFINSNTIHMTSQIGDLYHERIVVEMKDHLLSSILEGTGELAIPDFFSRYQSVYELSPRDQKYVVSILDGVAREIRIKDPGYKFMAAEKILRLLFFTVRYQKASTAMPHFSTKTAHRQISEVASYISQHYAEAVSLEEVAKHFYLNKSYLSRIFKENSGYTVNEYINVNRIREARRLLAETDTSVSDIARSLGYESLTYFERIFRKHTETSPLKYRKECLKQKEMATSRPQSHQGEFDYSDHGDMVK